MVKQKILKIAFDVDDTLIVPTVALPKIKHESGAMFLDGVPNYPVIEVYRFFKGQGHHMIVWSGGGIDYATRQAEKLGLEPDEVRLKSKGEDIDIAFDDCDVDLAKVNIKVMRVNNHISRKEWNEHKNV